MKAMNSLCSSKQGSWARASPFLSTKHGQQQCRVHIHAFQNSRFVGPSFAPGLISTASTAATQLTQGKSHLRQATCSAAVADSSCDFAVAMAKVADDTKCQDIVVLHVEPVITWTSYMVLVTVYSRPQLLAVLARIEKAAAEDFQREKDNLPGSSPWEAIDFGDVIVHIFTEEQRELYDLESFYATAEDIELPFLSDSSASDKEQEWAKQS